MQILSNYIAKKMRFIFQLYIDYEEKGQIEKPQGSKRFKWHQCEFRMGMLEGKREKASVLSLT